MQNFGKNQKLKIPLIDEVPDNIMKLNEFTIRAYQSGDERDINCQFNLVFGHSRSLEEWKWKFINPNTSKIVVGVASDKRLISHNAIQLEKFQYFGIELMSGQSVDSFSVRDKKAIQIKLFEKTEKCCFQYYGGPNGISFVFGFPGTRLRKLGLLKLNYLEIIPIKYWEKIIDNGVRSRFFEKCFFSVDLEKVDDLWKRARTRYHASIIRDGNWILKRYISHPNVKYKFLAVSNYFRYSSFGVCRVQNEKLVLVDLVWDGQSEESLVKLERQLQLHAKSLNIRILCMWFSGDAEAEQIFKKLNWEIKDEPQELHLVVKSFDERVDRKRLLDSFYLTKGCSDII